MSMTRPRRVLQALPTAASAGSEGSDQACFGADCSVLLFDRGTLSAPVDRTPHALVEVIESNLGNHLGAGNGPGSLHAAGEQPAEQKRIDTAQGTPADRLDDRTGVRLVSMKQNHWRFPSRPETIA